MKLVSHYCHHKKFDTEHYPKLLNPVQNSATDVLKKYFNTVLPSTAKFTKWSISLTYSNWSFVFFTAELLCSDTDTHCPDAAKRFPWCKSSFAYWVQSCSTDSWILTVRCWICKQHAHNATWRQWRTKQRITFSIKHYLNMSEEIQNYFMFGVR